MSTAGYTIHVTGIAPETTEEKLNSFFSFCGTISSLKKSSTTAAEITFQKESAAKTALMLNGGTLDGAHLTVESNAATVPATASSTLPAKVDATTPIGATQEGLSQEDKPKAAIIAEYLAHGYVLSDHIVQRAIDLDQKQGISSTFLNYVNQIDTKLGPKISGGNETKAHEVVVGHLQTGANKAKEVDQKHGISSRFLDYYSKAINTTAGQHVLKFYTETTKQVQDVHNEARRIADQKKVAAGGTAAAAHDIAPATTEKVDQVVADAKTDTSEKL